MHRRGSFGHVELYLSYRPCNRIMSEASPHSEIVYHYLVTILSPCMLKCVRVFGTRCTCTCSGTSDLGRMLRFSLHVYSCSCSAFGSALYWRTCGDAVLVALMGAYRIGAEIGASRCLHVSCAGVPRVALALLKSDPFLSFNYMQLPSTAAQAPQRGNCCPPLWRI